MDPPYCAACTALFFICHYTKMYDEVYEYKSAAHIDNGDNGNKDIIFRHGDGFDIMSN